MEKYSRIAKLTKLKLYDYTAKGAHRPDHDEDAYDRAFAIGANQ